MIIIHDSRNKEYRTPFGAVEAGTEVTLSIDVIGAAVKEAVLQYRRDEDEAYTPVQMSEVSFGPAGAYSNQSPDFGKAVGASDQSPDAGKAAGSDSSPAGGRDDQNPAARFSAAIAAPEDSCLLWYRFKLVVMDDCGVHSIYYCNNKDCYGGRGRSVESSGSLDPYQITVYKRAETPDWYKNGIVYQIFPDRFDRDEDWLDRCEKANKTVNDRRIDMQRIVERDWYRPAYYVRDSSKSVVKWPMYGGSLRGIKDRLDYLKSLGVTVIYLNPIFEASTNHRYDTGNYMKIDPALGTEQDFTDLANAAKDRGIRLILDGVFSHTGCDSIYFDKFGNYPQDGISTSLPVDGASGNSEGEDVASGRRVHGAWKHEDSPFRSWYKFDPDEKCGYKSWWGVPDLPEVIEETPEFQEYILGTKAASENRNDAAKSGSESSGHFVESEGVIPHWLKAGASGWRLDVADELPDSFIRGVRKAIKETDPDGLLIGEVWEDASNKISYGERRTYFAGDELDGTMNYPLRSVLLDFINYTITSGEAGKKLMSLAENYPRENYYGALNLIGSHDRARILTLMASDKDYGSAVSKVKLLSSLEYALPGVPCIYYGDEAGLKGAADPENRSGFPWGREDHDLQFHYRMLGVIYNEHPVLKDGDITMLSGNAGSNADYMSNNSGRTSTDSVKAGRLEITASTNIGTSVPDDVLAFIRNDVDERILVLVNRSYGETMVDLSKNPLVSCGYAMDLFTSEELKLGLIMMDPLSVKFILLKDEAPENEDVGRSAGVICHLSSLGENPLGRKARDFVDYIAEAGFGIWQVLPVNPPGQGDSPYDCLSAFAGNPAFIDYDEVPDDVPIRRGGLPDDETAADKGGLPGDETAADKVDLPDDETAADKGDLPGDTSTQAAGEEGFDGFCKDNAWWLHGYAAYCVIKEKLDGAPLYDWPDEYRLADPEVMFRKLEKEEPEKVAKISHEQYWFAVEWRRLKEYANSRGVRLMGDIPMYMSAESADAWTDRKIFRMNEDGRLSVHSGVPPDYFSKDGQDWGNPLYDWDELKKDGYGWWLRRIRQCARRFDLLRIDHFRALSQYYAIPEGKKPADGMWQHGPGADFICAVKAMIAEEGSGMKLLAEDLGTLDAGVYDLIKLSGLPGMDVWQFSSFEMMNQPEEVAKRRAFYTGTHDNNTLEGFIEKYAEGIIGHPIESRKSQDNQNNAGDGHTASGSAALDAEEKAEVEAAAKEIVRKIYESPAVLAMVQLQDVFMLGDDTRMNTPGLLEGNWKWKIPGDTIRASFADADERAAWFRQLAEATKRA